MNTNKLDRSLLIIYPHWHPVNLAGVHRPRLTGNFLPDFGWKVRVLTVKEEQFEEKPDPDFHKTFRDVFELSRVDARSLKKTRFIGDIGLRSFKFMRKRAEEILSSEKIDFIWIPIPSFYTALLGQRLYRKYKVPFGIDYIDPWVRDITNQRNLRAVLSQWIARVLEPRAVKRAALISGVSINYYMPVLKRNGLLERKPIPCIHAEFPYGFDPDDHQVILPDLKVPWAIKKKIWLYSGAFLPNSHIFLDLLFKAISELKRTDPELIADNEWWFIGTGQYPAKRITAYADDHNIEDLVFEVRERFPYLNTLNLQARADKVMIIGSTEKHYTASKTYQSLLSRRPVFSILHSESQALKVLEECRADQFTVRYMEQGATQLLFDSICEVLRLTITDKNWQPDLTKLEKYSARESARKLSEAMEKAISLHQKSNN